MSAGRSRRLLRWPTLARRWSLIGVPYLWMALLFAVPFLIVLKISLASLAIAMPPYTPLWVSSGGGIALQAHLDNYRALFTTPVYVLAFLGSLKIALVSTALMLLLGYPLAYCIARLPPARRDLALMLVVLPSWTSFLLRAYAWIGLLKANGPLGLLLQKTGVVALLRTLGWIDGHQLLYTPVAAYLGIVYCYLPFMVLPLYANLVKHDPRLLEAAYDLGARPGRAFVSITLPLSRAGIVAGCMLVAIPVVGEYVIPELMGGPDTRMIGRVLWNEFFANRDWPKASAIAVVMLALLLVPILWFNRLQRRQLGQART
ncbi:MAG: ABC transporter permease subunit [Pseudoxanthomonas sp.]